MFLYVFDKELEKEMEQKGLKKAPYPNSANFSVFILDDRVKLDFSNIDNTKVKITNKIIF